MEQSNSSPEAITADKVRDSSGAPIVVWGLGYIGLTTAVALIEAGKSVVGIDIDPTRLEEIRQRPVIHNAEISLSTDLRGHLSSGKFRMFSDPDTAVLERAACHFVCVPTEARGAPDFEPVRKVLSFIAQVAPTAPVIIESTLSPAWLGHPFFAKLNVAVAPRRDWFHSRDHDLRKLTRICASNRPGLLPAVTEILGAISPSIVTSEDLTAVVVAKAFENSLWYLLFSYVGELASHLTGLDFREVLRLAQTNWRTPFQLNPTLQVGGYCLPLSAAYIQDLLPDYRLATLEAAQRANAAMLTAVLRKVQATPGVRRVLILGIAYRPGLRVSTQAAGVRLIDLCRAAGFQVVAHDPLYTNQEIVDITGGPGVDIFEGIATCDCLIVCTDHSCYSTLDLAKPLEAAPSLRLIVDSCGAFRHYRPIFSQRLVTYMQLGTEGW